MALGAKLKLKFIDGTIPKPEENSIDYVKWTKCDYIINYWLLNLMFSTLSQSFLYAQSSFQLWKAINDQYGQTNGPQSFQLQHEISNLR